ncbi:EthD family reductase [Sandarakinorhabdus sp.]|jgi:uncharacterized protein (TIGR02118 family)|uniref:EthD family reductase n=1 Tax=Sandarakinorhabdus sp. TaxID=1916663 RepID=UPI00333E3705
MVKIVWLLRKADHLSDAEFQRWWLESHAPLAAAAPRLVRYVVNIAQKPDLLAGKPACDTDWDGVAEQWFANEDDLNAAYSRPVAGSVRQDTLAHVSRLERLIVREIEIPVVHPA